ncbi:MAG: hypothetical protein KAF64_10435 [Hydrogenophaga sp.]|uniref:hypothetical protein n=1 Tax=Hydrogenophaga sp. TaxID=1904254 RepID=UPI0025C03FFC|nr:hypothetical protein [Hydrogenophaga sp.]MBU7573761.1 hypothetical protein [Hydrogenophaga sp.]
MIRLSSPSRLWAGCVAGALALSAGLPVAAQSAPDQGDIEAGTRAAAPTKGEARLAKMLEGRVAGEPLSCIRNMPSQRMQTIDGVAYVYGSGNTIYVQRTRSPEAIDDNDTLVVTRTNGTQLCRFDIATTIDRFNGFFTGAVLFEDFVPYTRAAKGTAGEG